MFENPNDFIMRQIEMLGSFLRKIFKAETEEAADIYDENDTFLPVNVLIRILKGYVLDGKINEAEDLLFNEIERDRNLIGAGVWFYEKLSKMTEDELNKYNFSKEEIIEGLDDLKKIIGLENIIVE